MTPLAPFAAPETPTAAAEPIDASDSLVLEHLQLARQYAFEYLARAPRHTDRDEITSAAFLGLVEASRSYDAGRGVPFPAWATQRIRGAIVDAARAVDPLSRRARTGIRAVRAAEDHLQAGRAEVNDQAIATAARMSVDKVRALRVDMSNGILSSLDETLGDGGETYATTLIDADPTPLETLERRELDRYLVDAVESLPQRLREIVRGHFLEGASNVDLAARLSVTPQRISQLRADALRLLKQGLDAQFTDVETVPAAASAAARNAAAVSMAAAIAARRTYAQRLA